MGERSLRNTADVILDFDGVMANSIGTHTACRLEAFGQLGLSTDAAIHNDAHRAGNHPHQIIGWILKKTGAIDQNADPNTDPTVAEVVALKTKLYHGRAAEGLDAIDGALEFAAWAVATYGRRHLAIATTASREFEVLPFLRRHKLGGMFSHIVGKEDTLAYAAQNGGVLGDFTKPHPYVYAEAVRRLGANPLTATGIEDHPNGLIALHDAGLLAVGITTTHPAKALGGADLVVPGFTPIPEHLAPAA